MHGESTPARQALNSLGAPLWAGLARDMSELARELQADDDIEAVMARIVAAAVRELDSASAAAITLVDRKGQVVAMVPSDERARLIGLAQQRCRQGPCLETSRDAVTLRCNDLRTDGRWPLWAAAAAGEGVRSVLSFQLFVQSDSMGALEIYADQPDAFDADAENTGLLLAAHAAIAMADRRKVESMHRALLSRDVIGQAKGILMERYKISPVAAFDLLIKSSQTTHLKLHDIADALATTGELPTAAPHP